MFKIKNYLQVAFLAAFFSFDVGAHHGFGVHYDVTQQIKIEGVLQKVELRNPHSTLHVLVENSQESVLWSCETQARSVMLRKGIDDDRFVVGQKIVIEGSAARQSDRRCEVGTAHLADGTRLVFRSPQGRANIGVFESAETKSASVLGTWLRATFNGVPVAEAELDAITEAGKMANQSYSAATDDPSNDCKVANPVRAWVAPGSPTKISRNNNEVLIQHEFMDASRVVILDADPLARLSQAPKSDYRPNEMGYAYGQLSETELVVYTAGFKPGVLLTQVKGSGVLFTDQMGLTEHFKLNEETGMLDYFWEAVDRHYFPQGIKGQLTLTRVDIPVLPFDCKLTESE